MNDTGNKPKTIPKKDVKPVTDKTIGALNGMWAMLLKFSLVLIIPMLGLMSWLVSEAFQNRSFRQQGDRFTTTDWLTGIRTIERDNQSHHDTLVSMVRDEIRRIDTRVDELPPVDWQERIKRVEHSQNLIQLNQTRILTILDEMRKKP